MALLPLRRARVAAFLVVLATLALAQLVRAGTTTATTSQPADLPSFETLSLAALDDHLQVRPPPTLSPSLTHPHPSPPHN